ncbi:MAG: tetratricopeptide repeat protein [Candidatus Omnitrophota bacterium]
MNIKRHMNHRSAVKKKFLWEKILLVFFGLLLVLVILEIGLRVGGFVMLSMQERGNLRSIKQNGEFRIMCLGESTTQGQYPPYLEKILNKRNLGVKISVLDKGLTGTNTLAIRLGLEADLDKYQPDIVVTMMGGNDWMTMYYKDIPEFDTWIFRHCRVYRFGRLLLMHVLKKLKKEDIYSLNKPTQALKTSYPGPDKPHERAAESGPQNDSTYVQLGWLYNAQGKLDEAEQAFKKAAELNPQNSLAYEELGHAYRDQAKYSEAESAFKKAIELNPKSNTAHTGLGGLYKDQGKYSESETLLKKITEFNPQNDLAYTELGRLYLYQKRYIESEQVLKEAMRLNPENYPAYVVLSWVYRDQEKFTEAEQILNKAVELNPKYDPAYIGLGQVYKTQKRLAEAEQALKKASELNPQSMLAYGGLATIYGEMGKEKLSKVYADKLNNLSEKCYNPATIDNYRKLKQILDQRKVKLICVQYPMRSIRPLKDIFQQENVIFVDNEKIFKDAVKKEGYNAYFRDMFAGDFGHCTAKGNRLLAKNIADIISKEIFGK